MFRFDPDHTDTDVFGSSPFLIRIRIQGNDTDLSDPDPQHWRGGGDPAASDKNSVNSPLRAGQPVDICVGLKLEERRSWLIAHDIPTVATVFSSMGLDQHCCQLTFFFG